MCRVKQECQRINFVPVTWFLPDGHAVLLGFVSDSYHWSGGFYRHVPSTAVALYWTLWQSSLAGLLNDFSVAYLSTEIAAFSMLSGTSGGSMGCVFTSQSVCAHAFVRCTGSSRWPFGGFGYLGPEYLSGTWTDNPPPLSPAPCRRP